MEINKSEQEAYDHLMGIDYDSFTDQVECPYDEIQSRLSNIDPRLLHGLLGLASEAGELLDHLKAVIFYGVPLDYDNIDEELGDIEFFHTLCRKSRNLSREDVQRMNKAKLAKRYKSGKFTKNDAVNRDKASEMDALREEKK